MESAAQPTYEELQNQNREYAKRIERLEADLTKILTQFRALKRHVFGRKSEKLRSAPDAQQKPRLMSQKRPLTFPLAREASEMAESRFQRTYHESELSMNRRRNAVQAALVSLRR